MLDPKKLVLSEVTGEVVSSRKWSETHVSGYGGGGSGFVSGGRGQMQSSPVTITSSVTTKDQIFLSRPNGKELALNLSGFGDLACREGHVLTAVFAQRPREVKKDWGRYLAIYNHATEQTSWNWSSLQTMARVGLITVGLTFFGVWFVAGVLSAQFSKGSTGMVIGLVLGLIAGYRIEKDLAAARIKRIQAVISEYLGTIINPAQGRRAV